MSSVSIISLGLFSNALGRAHMLGKLLQGEHEVQIVGLGDPSKRWPPLQSDDSFPYLGFRPRSALDFYRRRFEIARELVKGDVIIASKPFQQSFGLALAARKLTGAPIILDIDDWDLGFLSPSLYWEARHWGMKWLTDFESPLYTRLNYRRTGLADAVTVSNSFLQEYFGGVWIPHARAEESFRYEEHRDGNDPIVLFLGSPRSHKGLDLLLEAWMLRRERVGTLRVIGVDDEAREKLPYLRSPLPEVEFLPPVPFHQMPAELERSDIVVIPQRSGEESEGQLPAKLIDAMAAGRAIIASSVGDIPFWLDGDAGILARPDDRLNLAEKIDALLRDPALRKRLGQNARARFLQYGSFNAVRPRLLKLVDELRAGNRGPTLYRAIAPFGGQFPG